MDRPSEVSVRPSRVSLGTLDACGYRRGMTVTTAPPSVGGFGS